MSKRLVVVDDVGQFTIVGEQEEPLPIILTFPVEAPITDETPTGLRLLSFNLIKVKHRFALYRQLVAPATSRFNDTFDPQQR